MPRLARFYDNALVKSRKKFVLSEAPALARLVAGVAPCAAAVAKAQAALRRDLDLGPATLRLMDLLDHEGPRAVPTLAAALGVTRQAIQPLVDARLAAGHVELLPNAMSRRSPLVRLTDAGRCHLLAVHARIHAFDEWMAARFLAEDVAIASRVLANLIRACADAEGFAKARARDEHAEAPSPAPLVNQGAAFQCPP